jgi:hypothetical protein
MHKHRLLSAVKARALFIWKCWRRCRSNIEKQADTRKWKNAVVMKIYNQKQHPASLPNLVSRLSDHAITHNKKTSIKQQNQ